MFWYWFASIAVVWAVCCAILAIAMRIRWRRSSSFNPIVWIPFYVVAPLAVLGLIFAFIFLIPPLCLLQAINMRSLAKHGLYARSHDDGVALCGQDETLRRLLPWPDLLEWREEFTHPVRTYTAIMTSGEEVTVEFLADDDLLQALESHGVRLTSD